MSWQEDFRDNEEISTSEQLSGENNSSGRIKMQILQFDYPTRLMLGVTRLDFHWDLNLDA